MKVLDNETHIVLKSILKVLVFKKQCLYKIPTAHVGSG